MSHATEEGGRAVATDKDLLRNIPMFARLSEEDREQLAEQLQTRDYKPQDPIFWFGENGSEMYLVQRGKVRLSYADEAGTEVTLAMLSPGAFFGELSLLDGGPRTATARAETELTLHSLDREAFYKFLERTPSAAVHMVATLGQRQRETMEKLRGVRNVNEQIEETITPLQRVVDAATAIGSSGTFVLVVLVFIGSWMVLQTALTKRLRPDLIVFPLDPPPTFFWLGFMITLVAFLMTVFVLNAQKRQADRDRIRNDLEYQINLKAQVEVMALHRKVDQLAVLITEKKENGTEPPSDEGGGVES